MPPFDWNAISKPDPNKRPCPDPSQNPAESEPKSPPPSPRDRNPKRPRPPTSPILGDDESIEIVFEPIVDPEDEWFEAPPSIPPEEDEVTVEDPPLEEEEDEEQPANQQVPPPTPSGANTYSQDTFASVPEGPGGIPGIEHATAVSNAVPVVTDQSPQGIDWLATARANDPYVVGESIDPGTMTTAQVCAYIWPDSVDWMRGTQHVYDSFGGFADPLNPTALEIEQYFVAFVLHFRELTQNPTPLSIDPCLMLRSLWSDERFYTDMWDIAYPGTCGTADGPCVPCGGGGNPHCGEAFVPNAADQVPYLADIGHTGPCSLGPGAAGIAATNLDIPWSVKLSRIMQGWFCTIDSHFGPFMGRETLGFHMLPLNASTQSWRGKWGGPLNAHPFNLPTDW